MPTIPQLPAATQVNPDDEVPLSQGGVTVSVTVAELLASTQPLLTVSSGTLLGRVSLGAGGPEPVAVGPGLAVANGALTATGSEISGFPQNASLAPGDQVVLNSGGNPALLPAVVLRGLYSAGTNISIGGNGVISASVPIATPTTPGAVIPAAGLALGSNGALAVNYGTTSGTAAQGNDPRIVGAEHVASKGQPNGYAALDASGRIPASQLTAGIAGGLSYLGVWNAATNQPPLTSGTGVKGTFYEVGTGGTTSLDGTSQWNAGDLAVFSGSSWQKISGALSGADLSAATVLAAGSTTPRSLAARFGDYVDINDFGLARDGVTDDSERVLAAVDAAIAKNGKLYVPTGGPILLAGAAQILLQNIAVVGDGLTDLGYPYGHIGSQFWITDTQKSPFYLDSSITIDGIVFFYPNQIDQPSAPIVYPPLFTSAPGSGQIALLTIQNCQITNAYDVLTVPENVVFGDVLISGNRICAVNTCFTLPNVPDVIYVTDNLFSFGVYQVEYLHGPGGGSHAQTPIPLNTTADAPAGSSQLHFSNTSQVTAGMPVQDNQIAPGTTVTAVSGNTVSISSPTLGDIPADSTITFVLNTYYLRNYTAQNATWLLITGNGTANAISTIGHGGTVATNNYVFGFRYGIHVSGGNLQIGRFTNTSFDEVGTILQCDNNGTVFDLQIDNFLAYGLLGTTTSSPPTTLFVIDNPPPDSGGNPNARLTVTGMTIGFSTGTAFDISGANVAEVKVTDCKLTRFANTAAGQPYCAMHIDAPNARLLFVGNDILPASAGNNGVEIAAVLMANLVGNSFSFLQAPLLITTTSGFISLAGNSSFGTTGSSAIAGTATANVQDIGNAWDQRPLNWNPIVPTYTSPALNGLAFRPDNGFGSIIAAAGASPNIALNLVSAGSGSISLLTRGFSPQLVVNDTANTTSLFATGGTASAAASFSAAGSSSTGLALQNLGGGPLQLGTPGSTGSSVIHLGALADQSFSLPAVSGGTYQVPNNTSDAQLTTAAGTIANLAIVLPTQPIDGQILDLCSVAGISALNIQSGNGAQVIGAPPALPANGAIRLKYFGGTTKAWFHRAFI
ncbi:MAG: hypothetical protein JO047_07165 [Alphaproteobacteria bacterium]|nr:hypothetical protein [Alphaproteobacteria bacterium]